MPSLDQWIADLESGAYKQGSCALRKKHVGSDIPRYCCLGVAAEQFGVEWKAREPGYNPNEVSYETEDGENQYLNEDKLQQLFPDEEPTRLVSIQAMFAELNDTLSLSFVGIAKLLRAYQNSREAFIALLRSNYDNDDYQAVFDFLEEVDNGTR